jgi:hypothetical protein
MNPPPDIYDQGNHPNDEQAAEMSTRHNQNTVRDDPGVDGARQ